MLTRSLESDKKMPKNKAMQKYNVVVNGVAYRLEGKRFDELI